MRSLRVMMCASFLFMASLSFSQSLSIGELLEVSNSITKPYDEDRAQIQNIVSSYLVKGYQLTYYAERNNSETNSRDFEHLLENVTHPDDDEQIQINTSVSTGKKTKKIRKTITVEFYTSSFTLYQNWLAYIKQHYNDFIFSANKIFAYEYRYGNRMIKIGAMTLAPSSTNIPPRTSYEIRIDRNTKNKYFVFIQFGVQ